MAGDWIKWVKGLASRREVSVMASHLKKDRHEVAGRLMVFWEWCDENVPVDALSGDGTAFVKMSPVNGDNMALIDSVVGTPGFADSLVSVDWLRCRDGRIELPHFGRHNGETAKTRARNASNQKKKRQLSEHSEVHHVDEKSPICHHDVTKMSPVNGDKTVTREEKRREEINTTSSFQEISSSKTLDSESAQYTQGTVQVRNVPGYSDAVAQFACEFQFYQRGNKEPVEQIAGYVQGALEDKENPVSLETLQDWRKRTRNASERSWAFCSRVIRETRSQTPLKPSWEKDRKTDLQKQIDDTRELVARMQGKARK
jgi:hypothetical protein